MGLIQWVLGITCALALVVVLVQIARDVPASNLVDGALALTEVVVLVQLVAGLIAVGGAPASVSKVVYVGYLVGAVLVLPVGWFWSQAERSRSGLGVLVVALLVVPFLILRLHQIWPGHG